MRFIRGDLKPGDANADVELVAAARSGSLQAREGLFRRHVQMVSALAFRLGGRFADARHITMETFQRAFSQLGDLSHPEALRPWLVGVVDDTARRATKRQLLRARLRLRVQTHPAFEAAVTSAGSEAAQRLTAFYAAADRLPPRLRTVLILRHLEKMSLPDIAVALEISVASVRRALAKAEARARIAPRTDLP